MYHRNQILIVDDMEINRAILCTLFEENYSVLEAENGLEALKLVQQNRDSIAVILLDIVMPVMDGFQLMERLQEEGILKRIPVILITADTFHDNEINGLNLGASDIIMKPFDPYIVKKRVQNSVELYQHKNHLEDLVEHQTKKLMETNDFVVDALSTIIEYRSLESGQHIRRIRVFTKTLLNRLAVMRPDYGLTPKKIATITSASAMHDIGKIAIPDSILLKPGRLTPDEFSVMKTHTTKGCEVLQAFRRMEDKTYLRYCYHICRYHHERWDGRGYPDGLKGDEIPVCAQAVAVADVYDALTSPRVYKPAIPHEKAMEMILGGECGAFSDSMMDCFRQVAAHFKMIGNAYGDSDEDDSEAFAKLMAFTPEDLGEDAETQIASGLQQASVALRKETLEREALINAVPGGVAKISIGDEFTILLASDGFYKLTGYTKAEYHSSPIDGKNNRLILKEDWPHVLTTVKTQAQNRQPLYVEYRIRRKDGSIATISVHGTLVDMEDGSVVAQAVYIDVTDSHQAQELLRMNEERYRIIIEQVQDVIFEWDMQNDTMYHSPAFLKKYGYEMPGKHFFESVLAGDIVYRDDREPFQNFKNLLLSGQVYQELEFRIRTQEGYRWCLIRATVIFDRSHQPIRAVGTLSDIDDYKRTNALLEAKAQKDLLTGLYNKITMENLIGDCLGREGRESRHALIILDIDDFKNINDTFGHMAGDKVLREISTGLRDSFRSEDILGRAGGDEFVIFLKDIPTQEVALEKADILFDVFRCFSTQQCTYPPISASIGIALYPENGRDFTELFRNADQALYAAKRSGKNCVRFFDALPAHAGF